MHDHRSGGASPYPGHGAAGSLDRVNRTATRRTVIGRVLAAVLLTAVAAGGCTTGLRADDPVPEFVGASAAGTSPDSSTPAGRSGPFGASDRTPAPAVCAPGPGK